MVITLVILIYSREKTHGANLMLFLTVYPSQMHMECKVERIVENKKAKNSLLFWLIKSFLFLGF